MSANLRICLSTRDKPFFMGPCRNRQKENARRQFQPPTDRWNESRAMQRAGQRSDVTDSLPQTLSDHGWLIMQGGEHPLISQHTSTHQSPLDTPARPRELFSDKDGSLHTETPPTKRSVFLRENGPSRHAGLTAPCRWCAGTTGASCSPQCWAWQLLVAVSISSAQQSDACASPAGWDLFYGSSTENQSHLSKWPYFPSAPEANNLLTCSTIKNLKHVCCHPVVVQCY